MKILLLDIETAPNISAIWGSYEQNAVWVERDWHMLSFAAKWLGEKKVYAAKLPDFKGYKKDPFSDKALAGAMWKLLDEADVVVAHNGDKFDIPKICARLLVHGYKPPSPFKTVDTKKVAKKYFGFSSNKLDELARQLEIGRKMQTGGYELWKGCLAGDAASWAKMMKYNIWDVELLEQVYLRLRGWMTNHPNHNLYDGSTHNCPSCGSHNVQARGSARNLTSEYKRYQCQDCGTWSRGNLIRLPKEAKIEIRTGV